MDIHEIHIASGFSIRALRKLEKLGVLRVSATKGHPETSRIRASLKRGNPLTAYQLISLYKNEGLLKSIGLDTKQQMRADDEIEALGDVKREACPWAIAANIPGAAVKEPAAISELALWLSKHIDAHDEYRAPKPYAYIACRMLCDIPDDMMAANYSSLAQALLQIRKHKFMDGYSHTNAEGKSVYHKKSENNFDL